jgi:4-hydroxythreonine-4-phosphate dehydrogenase
MNDKSSTTPIIGITMGDPAGIGPEIVVKALSRHEVHSQCRPVVFGDPAIIQRELHNLHSRLSINPIDKIDQAQFSPAVLNLFSLSNLNAESTRYGHPNRESGNAMGQYIIRSVTMALNHEIDAIITAPINKKSLQVGGYQYPGHTEMLAHHTSTADVVMMLAGEKLRVVPVTIHCALQEVPKLITADKIVKTILITDKGLKNYFSLSSPRIAVAALNPHAGEEGLFGEEEKEIIIPAIEQAQQRSAQVFGPLPADTLFYHASRGKFDAVVCMYHDQGLIPFKLLHFDDGVNITLGLPIIRTSVDHGTAYDIAGKGFASPLSLINAIRVAVQMAQARH